MMEDKIISDVLIHLDGWELQNKSHKHRHKPKNHRMLDAFNEDSEDIENTNIRKTVSAREILDTYEVAKIHVLNYIKRPVFPRTPVTHLALCMWTAGLLSQKARFRKQKVENSYNLINETKALLKPHIKHNPTIMTINGSTDSLRCDIENYRLYHHHHHKCPENPPHPCMAQHPPHINRNRCTHPHHNPYHHHHHSHHDKPHFCFEHDVPYYEDLISQKPNQYLITILPVIGELGETVTLKAYVRDMYGNRIDEGRVRFYIDDEEEI